MGCEIVDNKKRMMFVLDEDYYYITLKILVILKGLGCYKNSFVDYRKMAFIIEIIKDKENIRLYEKYMCNDEMDIFENEKMISIYCSGNIKSNSVKRVLFFLGKQEIVTLEKNDRFNCIDIILNRNEKIKKLLSDEVMNTDLDRVEIVKRYFTRVKSVKYETFIARIFGNGEVSNGKISNQKDYI